MATLDFVLQHLREVVAHQTSNRMSPRSLALCLTPSLFGTTENAETNSRVLELLIEHWPWLSSGLHRADSQLVSAEGLGHTFSEACRYAYQYLRQDFVRSLYRPLCPERLATCKM
ncbi:unnamed protein product [Dibothriocephalus latus]|uniref:Rho-GAP domain-containing protein n=1 Tax=Dibothriocephalus latus TaxID=60516 RepID=A0A3P7N0W7_DIBLA|nr:unnamed protein product [Dibothriocephalus latus]